jgi:hypothetical protein
MEQLTEALTGLLLAVLTALAGIAVKAVRAYADNLVQARLGAGSARVAGQIAAEVMGDDQVLAATREMIEAGVDAMQARFPQTAGKLPRETLAGMVTGELGRLGQAVVR